jgi:hypothetical protein
VSKINEEELTDENFALYAAQNYNNPRILNISEFNEDLDRFKYLKKLFTQYSDKGELKERLISNHLICIYNVFNYEAATNMCLFKLKETQWPALKTFLMYHNYIDYDQFPDIPSDLYVAKCLTLM